MPTPVFICGAECGIAAVGTTSAALEHWSAATNAPTVVTSGPATMRSTRALRFNPSASTSHITHTFAAAIASPATMVGRCYIYFATLPNANVAIVGESDTGRSIVFNAADSKLYASRNGSTLAAAGLSVTTGQWYRLDWKFVRAVAGTVDFKLDGTDGTQDSFASANGTITTVRLGFSAGNYSGDWYMDDIIVSGTSGDYPIGAGGVYGLYPSGDGAHVYSATTDFLDGGTAQASLAAAGSEVDTWLSLRSKADGALSTTVDNSNFVTNATGGTGEYLRWVAENLPADAATVNGVASVSTHHAASATSNTQAMFVVDQSAGGSTPSAVAKEITVIGAAAAGVWSAGEDLSDTTVIVVYKCAATGETTGAWTVANVNDLGWIWGSTDVNPDAYLDGICLEVDYVGNPDATANPSAEVNTVTMVAPAGSISHTPAADVIAATLATPVPVVVARPAAVTPAITVTVSPVVTSSVVTPAAVVVTATLVAPGGSIAQTPAAVTPTTAFGTPAGSASGVPAAVVSTVTNVAPSGSVSQTPDVTTATGTVNGATGNVAQTPDAVTPSTVIAGPGGTASGVPAVTIVGSSVAAPGGSIEQTPATPVVTVTIPNPTAGESSDDATAEPGAVVITGTLGSPAGNVAQTPDSVVPSTVIAGPAGTATSAPAAVVSTATLVGPGGSASQTPAVVTPTATLGTPTANVSQTPAAVTPTIISGAPSGSISQTPAAVVITGTVPQAEGSGSTAGTGIPQAVVVGTTFGTPAGLVSTGPNATNLGVTVSNPGGSSSVTANTVTGSVTVGAPLANLAAHPAALLVAVLFGSPTGSIVATPTGPVITTTFPIPALGTDPPWTVDLTESEPWTVEASQSDPWAVAGSSSEPYTVSVTME